jgi:hypothetical protein
LSVSATKEPQIDLVTGAFQKMTGSLLRSLVSESGPNLTFSYTARYLLLTATASRPPFKQARKPGREKYD